MPRLKECIAAVTAHARRETAPQTSSSAGARWADARLRCVAADGFSCDGLLLLAYPLHPAGGPRRCATRTSRKSRFRCCA